jgi:hypothetical protein
MLNVVVEATLERLCVIAEAAIRSLPMTWPTRPASAPVRVVASRRALPMHRGSGN